MGNQEWTIQRNWHHWAYKRRQDKKHHTIRVGHPYTQRDTNKVNKT